MRNDLKKGPYSYYSSAAAELAEGDAVYVSDSNYGDVVCQIHLFHPANGGVIYEVINRGGTVYGIAEGIDVLNDGRVFARLANRAIEAYPLYDNGW